MVYFIIPAYNEERNLPLLIKNTKDAMEALGRTYHILIVNDGSRDGTSALCREYAKTIPLEELCFETNRGVDRAFAEGFRKVLGLVTEGDVVVTKEADNTSDPEILHRMIARVESGCDVVLASCFAPEGGIEKSSIDRHILSFGANTLLKIFFPIKGIHTYSSFYRAFNAQKLKAAFDAYEWTVFTQKGFVCMVEMLVKLSRLPLTFAEVPMILKCNMREGASKMKRRSTIAGYLDFIGAQLRRPAGYDASVRSRFTACVMKDA